MRGMGSVYQRGSVWWIKYSDAGRVVRESSNSPYRNVAVALLKQRQAALERGEKPAIGSATLAFADLLDAVEEDYVLNDKASLERMQGSRKHIERLMGARIKAIQVDESRIDTYKAARKREGAANATINRELSLIKRAFSLAIRKRKLSARPAIEMLAENNVREGFIERADLAKLLAAFDSSADVARDITLLRFYLPWRSAELLAIECRQVEVERKAIRMFPGHSKAGEGRLVFLPPEAWEIVERWYGKRAGAWGISRTLFHRKGKPVKTIRWAFERARERAGLPHLWQHDMRRSGARLLRQAGARDKEIMEAGGWRTRSTLDRYHVIAEADMEALAQRVARLGTVTGTAPDEGEVAVEGEKR